MRNFEISLVFVSVLIFSCSSLPVKETSSSTEKPNDHKKENDDSPTHNLENIIGKFCVSSLLTASPHHRKTSVLFILEYERYLKEVVGLLESDPEFRKKLDSANEADIRSGKIAQELELVDHNVRTKLDELKRNELERLRGLAMQMYERENQIDREHMKIAGTYFC